MAEDITPNQRLSEYIGDGDSRQAINYLASHKDLLNYSNTYIRSWLHYAARHGLIEVVDYLIREGFDINHTYGVEQATPINEAVCSDEILEQISFVRMLLDRGANPNISRTILSALNPRRGDEDVSLELVRLLVEEGGADVNRVYDVYGDPNNTFTAVEWAEVFGRPKIAAYLRSQGAIDRPPQPTPPPPTKKKRKS